MNLQLRCDRFHPPDNRERSDDHGMHTDAFQLPQIFVKTVKVVFMRNDIDRHMDVRPIFAGKPHTLGDIFQFKITGARTQRKPLAAQIHGIRTVADRGF